MAFYDFHGTLDLISKNLSILRVVTYLLQFLDRSILVFKIYNYSVIP